MELLVEAAALVPEAQFVFMGGEPVADRAAARGRRRRIRRPCVFAGKRPSVRAARFLGLADVVASPRRRGVNTPFKVYTYLASGRPLLATRIETHTQLLDDANAWLVEATPEALAEGIRAALADPAGGGAPRRARSRRSSSASTAPRGTRRRCTPPTGRGGGRPWPALTAEALYSGNDGPGPLRRPLDAGSGGRGQHRLRGDPGRAHHTLGPRRPARPRRRQRAERPPASSSRRSSFSTSASRTWTDTRWPSACAARIWAATSSSPSPATAKPRTVRARGRRGSTGTSPSPSSPTISASSSAARALASGVA